MANTLETDRSDILAFDQNTIDATWERTQEQAMRAFRDGDAARARACWSKALKIAERHFPWGDPRLGTSLTNQAFAMHRQQQIHQANKLFEQAQRCWEDSWRWVPMMVPPPRPEEPQADQYDEAAQIEFYDVIGCCQQIAETLQFDQQLPIGSLEQWHEIGPNAMTDVKKLMAALFLIVSAKAS